MLTELKESGDISEDEMDRGKKKVEDVVAEASHAVDASIGSKEKEILTV
jgi:ribosome recycling factor